MNGRKFKFPMLSDPCDALRWLNANRASIMMGRIPVQRWRFPDGSIVLDQGGHISALAFSVRSEETIRDRAISCAFWRRFRVWWQRRPFYGDMEARAQIRRWRRERALHLARLEGAWI